MTTFNTNTDLPTREQTVRDTLEMVMAQLRRLAGWISTLNVQNRPSPEQILANAARREAARRSVDNLLR